MNVLIPITVIILMRCGSESWSVMSDYLPPHGLYITWNSPGQNTGVGESESEVTQSCPTLCDPMDCILPGSSVHEIFQARVFGVGCHFPFLSPGDLPNPRIEPRSPALRADSLPAEPQGKPFNEVVNLKFSRFN